MNEDVLQIYEQKSEPQKSTPKLKSNNLELIQQQQVASKAYLSPLIGPAGTVKKVVENDSNRRSQESQISKISAKKIDLFGKFKLDKMKNYGSTVINSKPDDTGLETINNSGEQGQDQNEQKWKFGTRRLTVQLDKVDQSSNSSASPEKFNKNSQRIVSPDKYSMISYDKQSTRKSNKDTNLLNQSSLGQKKNIELYSPQPRRQMLQNRAIKQMNIPGLVNSQKLLQSPMARKQNSLSKRQMMFQKQRPGMLDIQSMNRSKGSIANQVSPSPLFSFSRQFSPKSAALVPMSPMMSIDSRAKHSKVIQKLIKDSDTLKQKTKKEKYRKKNTILKNAGGFIKTNTKNRSYQGAKEANHGHLDSTENKDEEDVELEVFKQFMEANQQEPSVGVFSPDTLWKSFWDFLMFIWIVWQAIYIPFKLCFDQSLGDTSDAITILDYFMDTCFSLDIILNFNTGFYKNGVLILNRQLIVVAYLKSWFILDLVSTIPYSTIVQYAMEFQEIQDTKFTNTRTSQLLRLFKVLRFLRFLKLLRVLKLSSLKQKYEDLIYNDNIGVFLGIMKILILILFLTHTFACIFWLTGVSSAQTNDISWVIKQGLLDEQIENQYITSMYWAFTTLVSLGYGDISAQNTDERLVCMMTMIIFSCVYAFTLSQISKIVADYNTAAVQFKENMFYVQKWMQQHDLRKDLSQQIRRYLEYQWDLREQQKIEEQDVMNLLNQDLREKLILYTNAKQLRNLSFCNQFTVDFIGELSFKMQTLTFGVGENIILEQEDGDKIYFITSGKVCVLHRKTHTYLDDLTEDDYFGEISFFTEMPRTTSVKSRDFTNVIYLDRASYFYIAESSQSNAMGVFYKLQNALHNNDYSYMNIKCFICRGADHIAIHYMKDDKSTNVKKGSSTSLSQQSKYFSPSNFLNTHEQMEMRDVALLVDYDEKNIKQVNTLNTQVKDSLQSQEMIRHLYQEAGYELQKDSFETELSSLNGVDQSEQNESISNEEGKTNKARQGNLPSFYKVVNLENNKSIKLSQFDNIKPGMLEKNKNYTSSSESSESENNEKKTNEYKTSPHYRQSPYHQKQTMKNNSVPRSKSPPQRDEILEDTDEEDIDDDELIEDFCHVETILEVEENEEETPGNSKRLKFKNTLRKYLFGKQQSDTNSNDSSSQNSSPIPLELLSKNSKKNSSTFLKQMRKEKLSPQKSRKSSKIGFFQGPIQDTAVNPNTTSNPNINTNLDHQNSHTGSTSQNLPSNFNTLDDLLLNDQTISRHDENSYFMQLKQQSHKKEPSSTQLEFEDDNKNSDCNNTNFRAQSLQLPQLIQLQSSLLQKQQSRVSVSSRQTLTKRKTNIYSREQLQQIQELDDEFDPIQEESNSVSYTATTVINRLSSLDKKSQMVLQSEGLIDNNSPTTQQDYNNNNHQLIMDNIHDLVDHDQENKQTFEASNDDEINNSLQQSSSKRFEHVSRQPGDKTLTESLSFKTSQERIQYFSMLEQEINQELQYVLQDDSDCYQQFNSRDQQNDDDYFQFDTTNIKEDIYSHSRLMKHGFTMEDISFLEQMEEKNQNNDVVRQIEQLIENKKQEERRKNWQIRVDSLDAHDFIKIISPSPPQQLNNLDQPSSSQQQSLNSSSYIDNDCENDNSIDTALENKIIKEFELQIMGLGDGDQYQNNSSCQDYSYFEDQSKSFIQPPSSDSNSFDVTFNNPNQIQTFLDITSQGHTYENQNPKEDDNLQIDSKYEQ